MPLSDFSYWQKAEQPLFQDLVWNLPERKTGQITVLGGNSQSFATPYRVATFLEQHFPLQSTQLLLPESLQKQLPVAANLTFAPATASGSFAKSPLLNQALTTPALLVGDFSKNAETAVALTRALAASKATTPDQIAPVLLARDTVDLLTPTAADFIDRGNLTIFASVAQLQKLFRALYYPKVILLSMPLAPLVDTLHKFTLSYENLTLVTFHTGQLIVAHQGSVTSLPLSLTPYSVLTLWNGQPAASILAFQFYNPGRPFESTLAALTYR